MLLITCMTYIFITAKSLVKCIYWYFSYPSNMSPCMLCFSLLYLIITGPVYMYIYISLQLIYLVYSTYLSSLLCHLVISLYAYIISSNRTYHWLSQTSENKEQMQALMMSVNNQLCLHSIFSVPWPTTLYTHVVSFSKIDQ